MCSRGALVPRLQKRLSCACSTDTKQTFSEVCDNYYWELIMKNSRIWTGALAAGIIACLIACTQPSNTIVPNKPSASLAVITLKDSNTNNPIFSEKEWLTERDCVVSSEIKEFINNNMSKKYYDASIGNYTEDILWMKTVDGGSTYSKFSTADIIKENTTLVPYYCNYKSTQNIATSVTSADSNGIIILLI